MGSRQFPHDKHVGLIKLINMWPYSISIISIMRVSLSYGVRNIMYYVNWIVCQLVLRLIWDRCISEIRICKMNEQKKKSFLRIQVKKLTSKTIRHMLWYMDDMAYYIRYVLWLLRLKVLQVICINSYILCSLISKLESLIFTFLRASNRLIA